MCAVGDGSVGGVSALTTVTSAAASCPKRSIDCWHLLFPRTHTAQRTPPLIGRHFMDALRQMEPHDVELLAHQREEDGDDVKAIQLMDRALRLRIQRGHSIAAIAAAAERLVVKCNTVAVRCFKHDDYEAAASYLAMSMQLTDPAAQAVVFGATAADLRNKLRATSLNNLGCMERRRGRPEAAVRHLEQALALDDGNSAATLVNIAALYAQLGLAAEGVSACQRALAVLDAGGPAAGGGGGLRAVACHNMAMCLESTRPQEALQAYEAALRHATAELGPAATMTESIRKNRARFLALQGANPAAAAPTTASTLAPPSGGGAFLPPISLNTSVGGHTPRKARTPRERPARRDPSPVQPREPDGPRPTAPPRTARSGSKGPAAAAVNSKPSTTAQSDNGRSTTAPAASQRPRLPVGPPAAVPKDAAKRPAPPKVSSSSSSRRPEVPDSSAPPVISHASAQRTASMPAAATVSVSADEDEKRKDDVVSFLVARLGALLAVEDTFEQRYAAAVKIQCLARKEAAKQSSRKRRRQRAVKFDLVKMVERHSANRIIAFFRMLVERRREQERQEASKQQQVSLKVLAAVKIQSVARRWLAIQMTRRLRRYNRRFNTALKRLQCWFRCCLARRMATRLRSARQIAVTRKLTYEHLHRAARDIQRIYRSHLTYVMLQGLRRERRQLAERDRDNFRVACAKRIQRCWRCRRARERVGAKRAARQVATREQHHRENVRHAVRVLQAWCRGVLTRDRFPEISLPHRKAIAAKRHAVRTKAALVIQFLIRRFVARCRVARRRDARQALQRSSRLSFLAMRFSAVAAGYKARRRLGGEMKQRLIADLRRRTLEELRRLEATEQEIERIRAAEAATRRPPEPQPAATTTSTLDYDLLLPDDLAGVQTAAAPETSCDNEHRPSEEPATVSEPLQELPVQAAQMTITPVDARADPPLEPRVEEEQSRIPPAQPASNAAPLTEANDTAPLVPRPPPVRRETPVRLSTSCRQLEQSRKAELARRQHARLDTLQGEEARHKQVLHGQASKAAVPRSAVEVRRAKQHTAARTLQKFFRICFDRSLFRQKRQLLAEYVDQLVALHLRSPKHAVRGAMTFTKLETISQSIPADVVRRAEMNRHARVIQGWASFAHSRQRVAVQQGRHNRRAAAARALQQFRLLVIARRERLFRTAAAHALVERRVAAEGRAAVDDAEAEQQSASAAAGPAGRPIDATPTRQAPPSPAVNPSTPVAPADATPAVADGSASPAASRSTMQEPIPAACDTTPIPMPPPFAGGVSPAVQTLPEPSVRPEAPIPYHFVSEATPPPPAGRAPDLRPTTPPHPSAAEEEEEAKRKTARRHRAAIVVQRFFTLVKATRQLQRRQRAVTVHRERGVVDEQRDIAAVHIQCSQRQRLSRAELQRRRAVREQRWEAISAKNSAAVKIQTNYRGHHARTRVKQMQALHDAKWAQYREAAAHEVVEDYSVFQ